MGVYELHVRYKRVPITKLMSMLEVLSLHFPKEILVQFEEAELNTVPSTPLNIWLLMKYHIAFIVEVLKHIISNQRIVVHFNEYLA